MLVVPMGDPHAALAALVAQLNFVLAAQDARIAALESPVHETAAPPELATEEHNVGL